LVAIPRPAEIVRGWGSLENAIADALARWFYVGFVQNVRTLVRESAVDDKHLRGHARDSWNEIATHLRGASRPVLAQHVARHIRRIFSAKIEDCVFLLFFYPDEGFRNLRFWCPADQQIRAGLGVPYSEQTMVDGIAEERIDGIWNWTSAAQPDRVGLMRITSPRYRNDLTADQLAGRTSHPEFDWLVGVKSAVYLPVSRSGGFFRESGPTGLASWTDFSAMVCICSPIPNLFGDRSFERYRDEPSFFERVIVPLERVQQHVRFSDAVALLLPLEARARQDHEAQLELAYRGMDHEFRNAYLRMHSVINELESIASKALRRDVSIDVPLTGPQGGCKDIEAPEYFHHLLAAMRNEINGFETLTEVFKGDLRPLEGLEHTLNLSDLVRDVCGQFAAEHRDLTVEQHVSTEPLAVRTERSGVLLRRSVEIILSNAHRFGGGGVVTVTTRADRQLGRAYFECADTGRGFDPEETNTLFRPFTSTRKDKARGVGIGLFRCRQYVRLHAGDCFAGNRDDANQGARVGFWIPFTTTPDVRGEP
jgi:signal transduction histidine kinase